MTFERDPNLTDEENAEALVGFLHLEYPGHTGDWYIALIERMIWANEHDLDMTDCPVQLPDH